jgi:hypothetical protein
MSIYSTVAYLYDEGQKEGRQRGIQEGACRQLAKLLSRHGKRSFGPLQPEQRNVLESLTDRLGLVQLEQLRDRYLSAQNWAELLAGVTIPESPPTQPEYLLPFEFDPTPMPPSIDQYAKVRTEDGEAAVVHLRFQRLYQEDLGAILFRESVHLRERYRCPVKSVVLVLWKGADGPALTGQYRDPSGSLFCYQITRLWEKDVDEMLGSCGTIPFAPLARGAPERLPEIVHRMAEVISSQAKDQETIENLWGLAYLCMGLRYPAEQVNTLLADVLPTIYQCEDAKRVMSDGYYAGVSQGQEKGALQAMQCWVLTLGKRRLGEPPSNVPPAVEMIRSQERLEQLAARVLKGATWKEVLALS